MCGINAIISKGFPQESACFVEITQDKQKKEILTHTHTITRMTKKVFNNGPVTNEKEK